MEYGSNGGKSKSLLIKEYLDEIKPYLKYILNNLRKSDTQESQLTIAINFISFKDTDEDGVIKL